jgi:hypothetical protein
MPFACDLESAPLGSWAEYERTPDKIRERYALVGKGPEGTTIELTLEFPSGFSQVHRSVQALVFPLGKGPPQQLQKRVIQEDAYDPMEMSRTFQGRIDPNSLVGSDDISVRGGSFSAKRYHYLTRYGENVDAWVSDGAWPTCLIRLDAEQKQTTLEPDRFRYELIATGGDAKAQITKPAVPYDVQVLKKRDDERRIREHRPDNAPRVGDTIER